MFESIGNAFHSVFGGGDNATQKPQSPAAPAPAPAPTVKPAHAPPTGPPAAPTAGPGAAPAPGQDPAATASKPIDKKAMAEAANNIFKSMDGWWVAGGDQAKVLDQLRGKSAEEIAEIRKSYADHFPGHDLDADIGKNLSKDQLKEAQSSLSGNKVSAAVEALKQAKSATLFGNCDKDQVTKILNGMTDPKEREEVFKQVGPDVLATLDGRDKQLIEAQFKGDKAKENAVKIDEAMHGGLFGGGGFLGMGIGQDKDAVNKALESASTKEERDKLSAAYAEQTKDPTGKSETLAQTIDANFSGTEKTVATALLDGDKYKASAAKMKLATEGWLFTDKEAIYKELEKSDKNDPEMHKKIVEAYNKEYGQGPNSQNLDAMIEQNFSGLDKDKAKMLEDKGKLDDTFAMKYAMHGSWLSTDKELIKKTLEGKDADQVKTLVEKYQKDFNIDLRKELEDNTSGRAGFEIGQMMKGEPKTPEERLARAEEAYQFERGSGSSAFSTGFMDMFSDKGKLLDAQHDRIKELAEKAQAGKLTKEDEKRLEELTGYQSMDVKTYQESKDAVANTAATAAAVTAGVIVTVASGGTAAPAAVALASAVAGGGASIATKIAIQGAGYSNEDLRNDLIMTGVSAATGGALGALGGAGGSLSNFAKGVTGSELGQQLIVAGVSGAAGNAINNVTSASLDPNTWKGANPLGTLAKAGGMGLLTGTASGLASGYVNNIMGQGGAGYSAFKGGVSGGAGAVAGNLVNPEMYHGDSGQLLNKWITSVAGGTASGAAAGYQGAKHEEYLKAKAAAAEQGLPEPPPPVEEATPNKPANEPEAANQTKVVKASEEPPAGNTTAAQGEKVQPEAKAAAKVIETLPEDHASGITKALPPEEAAKMMQALPKEKAAQLSEQMRADAAAQLHDQMPAEAVAKVQSEMPPEKVVAIGEQTPTGSQAPSERKTPASTLAEQHMALDELKQIARTPEDRATIKQWEQEYRVGEPSAHAGQDVDGWGIKPFPHTVPDDSPLLRPTHLDNSPERQLYRQQKVNEILTENGAQPVSGRKPILHLMGGGGASGKGTVKGLLTESGELPSQNVVRIDPDEIKTGINEYQTLKAQGDSRGAAVVHEESSAISKQVLGQAMEMNADIVYDVTLGNPAKALKQIEAAKAAGYEVHLIGVTIDPEVAVSRAASRAESTGRYVPTEELLKAHRGFSEGFEAYASLVDKATLYDTGGERPTKVASRDTHVQGEDANLKIHNPELYEQFQNKASLNVHAQSPEELYPQPSSSQQNVAAENPAGESLGQDYYRQAGMENLRRTSRTAAGTVDTSASANKAANMAEGLTGDQAALLANRNYEGVLENLYQNRDRQFKSPAELRAFIDAQAAAVNGGILKDGVLARTEDSSKYPYTRVAELEPAMQQFHEELFQRLNNPQQDPIELAGWVDYRMDLTDHFYADGCGKSSKAISAWTLMRNGQQLPQYPSDRKQIFDNAPTVRRGLSPEADDLQEGRWQEFYRGLFE